MMFFANAFSFLFVAFASHLLLNLKKKFSATQVAAIIFRYYAKIHSGLLQK